MGNVKYKLKAVLISGYVLRGEYSINTISIISYTVLDLVDMIFLKHDRNNSFWCAKSGENLGHIIFVLFFALY